MFVFLLIQLGVLVYFCHHYPVKECLISTFKICRDYLATHAFWMLCAVVFLPTFGVPITPFFILAGSACGMHGGLLFCLIGIGLNLVVSYFFYRHCLNKFLFRFLFKRFNTQKENAVQSYRFTKSLKWAILVQMIPTLPYAVQNYILASLTCVHFSHYLGISWLCQFIWACGFVCGGNEWGQGHVGVKAIFLLACLTWITHRAYKHLKSQNHAKTVH